MAKYNFRCKFCGLGFKLEDRYLKHKCRAMERDEEIRTPVGMAALSYYQLWMKEQKRAVPNVEAFLNSKLYTSFVKFAKFAQETDIPNAEQYIKFMIRKDIHPTIWTNDQIYSEYLQWLDRGRDPKAQAQYTVDYLFKVAEALDCDVGDIFNFVRVPDVITMLRKRLLSPWILLPSTKFREFIKTKATPEQRQVIEVIIKPKAWAEKIKKNPQTVEYMKKIVHELKL